jgi:uncharacterized protein YraI
MPVVSECVTMNSLRSGLLAASFTLLGVATAFAAPVITTANVNLRAGAGTNYAVVGTVEAGRTLDIGQCQNGWCSVGSGGWVFASYLDFSGTQPRPDVQPRPPSNGNSPWFPRPDVQPRPPLPPQPQFPVPPAPPPPVFETGTVCFFSEPYFRGASFCMEPGDRLDYLPGNWDDRIRSVAVEGVLSVEMCTGESFYGACTTAQADVSVLPPRIDYDISSIEVY